MKGPTTTRRTEERQKDRTTQRDPKDPSLIQAPFWKIKSTRLKASLKLERMRRAICKPIKPSNNHLCLISACTFTAYIPPVIWAQESAAILNGNSKLRKLMNFLNKRFYFLPLTKKYRVALKVLWFMVKLNWKYKNKTLSSGMMQYCFSAKPNSSSQIPTLSFPVVTFNCRLYDT